MQLLNSSVTLHEVHTESLTAGRQCPSHRSLSAQPVPHTPLVCPACLVSFSLGHSLVSSVFFDFDIFEELLHSQLFKLGFFYFVMIRCGLSIFGKDIMELTLYLCAYWPFVCLLLWNIYSNLLSMVMLDYILVIRSSFCILKTNIYHISYNGQMYFY